MQLKVTEKVSLAIKLTDKFGNPAVVDGVPIWSVTNPSLATVSASADGMSSEVLPLGPVGSFKVQVLADADLGEGVKTIAGELPFDLLAGDATTIIVEPGEPSPIE